MTLIHTSEIVWWVCVLLVNLTPPESFQLISRILVSPFGSLRPPWVLGQMNGQFLFATSG